MDLVLQNNSLGVDDLLSPSGGWNESLIRASFTNDVASAIIAIPLSNSVVEDRVVWRLEKQGRFSMKTAYRHSFAHSIDYQPSNLQVGGKFW